MNPKHQSQGVRPAGGMAFLLLISLLIGTATADESIGPNETRLPAKKIIAVIPPDAPPHYFRDETTGGASGFSVDIMNEVAKRAGLSVDYIFAESWDLLEQAVLSGKADLVPNLTIDEERLKRLIFTVPVETMKISLIARASDTLHNHIEAGMKIGVMTASSVDHFLSQRGDIIRRPYPGLQPLLLDLLAGRVDLAMAPASNMLKLARDAGIEERIRIIEPCEYEAKRGMALRPGNEALRDRLNTVIDEFVATMAYEKIFQKWWGKPAPFWNTRRVAGTIAAVVAVIVTLFMTLRFRERRRAETALRESEEIFRQLMEHSPIYVFFKDEKIRALRLSKNYEKMLGKPVEELLGKTMDDLFPSDLAKKIVADDLRILNEGKAIQVEEELDGRFYATTKFPIYLDGKPRYLAGYTIDITDRKQAEAEKRDLEERLQRAEKMEALGTLAGGVAHDLNNVLGVVVGYAELLLNDMETASPLRRGIETIMAGGQKAAAIVQDLLTLARRGVPNRSVLNLNKIIVANLNSPEFETLSSHYFGVRIRTRLEPDLLNLSGSAVHLGKTLFNLVSNAVEAMPQGGVLTIKTANQYLDMPIQGYDEIREGDYVVLSVSDTGEGIPAADLKRIFEPFYTKKMMGRSGTGLGLAVVWGTVKDHLGYINVQSEAGKGSTFTLYFPVAREELSAEAPPVPMSEYRGKGETLLVVDDIKEQRDLAKSMLTKLDYKVESVAGGEEALAYLKAHPVDLLILDMIMDPGMDGLDTYKKVLEIRPTQKAIIVSGFSESERVSAAQTLGAGSYVRKPYVMEKLGLAVKKELERAALSDV